MNFLEMSRVSSFSECFRIFALTNGLSLSCFMYYVEPCKGQKRPSNQPGLFCFVAFIQASFLVVFLVAGFFAVVFFAGTFLALVLLAGAFLLAGLTSGSIRVTR